MLPKKMKIYNLDEDTLLDEAEGSTQTEGMDAVRLVCYQFLYLETSIRVVFMLCK